MTIIDDYKRVARISVVQPTIKPFTPQPSNSDYETGEIQRYFVQQVNQINGEIFEVSKYNFTELQSSPLYLRVSLRWKISGPAESVRTNVNGKLIRERSGVLEANQAAITQAAIQMPRISQKLSNPFQFWRTW